MMYGFSQHRRQMLDAELQRMAEEMPPLGALRLAVTGDFALGRAGVDTQLELVVVQETEEPYRRREEFWVTHLRPRVGTRFMVFTPEEFEELSDSDPVLARAERTGEVIFGA
ncbi:MAG: hypothetical protein ACOC5M_03235 [Chloroflexota bacterium]